MNKYNYLEAITNDIECWMDREGDPFDISQFENREEAAEFLRDELWTEDDITGNGPDGYASEEECEEYLCHNWDLVIESFDTFGISASDLRAQYKKNNLARYIDCSVRLYVLDNAIESALITWENYGFKYKGEENGT